MDTPQIPQYYANKKILVTGATGFMGKALVWKLLQSCYTIDTIYVLIRSKYGKSVNSRKQELFDNVIFDEVKKNNPSILEKVKLIDGDIGKDGIGLSSGDETLLIDQISVVFHGAANLKFNANLKNTVNVNTAGTLRMLRLAERMKKLEAFVYISTAYCCCENNTVEEKLYPAKHRAHDVISLVTWMAPEMLDMITPKLIYPLPNTYTYAKRLTESLLSDFRTRLPLIVARPTIVVSAVKEPMPGWTDNLNGPAGFYLAAGAGILRVTMAYRNAKPNVISVDTAVNGILTLPWANRKEDLLKEIAVYNVGETEHEPLTWKEYGDMFMKNFYKCPFEKTLWSPPENPFTDSIVFYNIKSIFCHWLPAYVLDFVLRIIGQKTFLVRIQTKLHEAEKLLRYFGRRHYVFANEKMLQINNIMSEADKRIFPVTMKEITNDQEYTNDVMLYAKKALMKEDLSKTNYCIKKAKVMYCLDKFVVALKWIIFVKILTIILNIFLEKFHFNQHYDQQMESS